MMSLFRKILVLAALLMAIVFPLTYSSAQDASSYDKYTELLHKGSYTKEKDTFVEKVGNAPAVPLELTKAGIEKVLIWVEKTHLNDKVSYAWGKIHEWGFHPTGQQLYDKPQNGYNILWDRSKLIKASPIVENAGFTAWNGLNEYGYYDAAGKLNADNILNTGLYANQLFKYENREREPFYGVGHDTSRGVSYTYKLQAMNYETRWGKEFKFPGFFGKLNVEGQYDFRRVHISGGRDGAKHNIENRFNESSLAGVHGGEYHIIGANIMHDDRNSVDDPTYGGYRKFTILYNQGLNGDQFEFVKYRFEAAQFFEILSNKNVVGIRFAGESNSRVGHKQIPFFEMARLGGWSSLRGYEYNRFFDNNSLWMSFEYRYNVWTFKRFKLDLVPFLDIGSVYGESGNFAMADTRISYGGAARWKIRDRVNIDFEVGHGDEGTQFYVKYTTPY
ncbi:MAG: BamA/TamA family outer membrane protein [Candidatus Omnitrophica bacterium]|nr:BamA/TamA family outer membrane protein [Candidatus Omnitrophota bacterium]